MGKQQQQKKRQSTYKKKNPIQPVQAKTPRQQELIDSICENQMSITTGYPGTGKTYIPAALAADGYYNGDIEKIVLARPNIAAGATLGFRPGDLHEKLKEWFAEIIRVLGIKLSPGAVQTAIQKGNIELVPFETMRGRTFDDALVLLDEAQNTTSHEMKMFLTRIGSAKVVVNGDVMQSDLTAKSGLRTAIDIISRFDMDVPIVEFQKEDIIRGGLCREWIVNFMDYEKEE